MEKRPEEIRLKIHLLKAELSQAKSYYNNKIALLSQLETQLRRKPAVIGMLSQKLATKQEQKWEEVKDKLSKLKKERDEKIQKIEDELNGLEKTYKENHSKNQETNRKSREEKLKNVKNFLIRYKYLFIGLAVIVVLVNIALAIPVIIRNNEISREKNRDYYINIDEGFSFDCNIEESNYSLFCEERIIEGTFSNYESVKFSDQDGVITHNNAFAKRLHDSVPAFLYQTSNYDVIKLNGFDTTISITLENIILNSGVTQKSIPIHYSFTDADKAFLTQKHDEWVKRKAEEEARAQREAEERKAEEEKRAAEQKAEEEARAQREAEERKAEEEKRAAEQKAAEEAERAKRTGYIGQYIEDPNSRFADDDIWTFNADGTAKYSAHQRVTYTLEQSGGSYYKFRATSWYMDWILEFSSDWSRLEATNDFNGEKSYFIRM